MINLEKEKSLALNAQERYDIMSFATHAADFNGFVNSFLFMRALYVYAAIMLYPENKDEYVEIASTNVLDAWNKMLEDGLLQKMEKDYKDALDILAEEGANWYEEYTNWAHSARSILDVVQDFTGNIVENAATELRQTAEETGVNNIIDIATDWGMNRDALKPVSQKEKIEVNEESLFTR